MNKITITISGPAKSGKSLIKEVIEYAIDSYISSFQLPITTEVIEVLEQRGPPPLPPPTNRPESGGERMKC